jgi:hypothetical protein
MVVLFAVACASGARDGEATAAQRRDALVTEMRVAQRKDQQTGKSETGGVVRAAYERLFPAALRDAILAKADRVELAVLFDVTNIVASNTLDPKHVHDAASAFRAMDRVGAASDVEIQTLRSLMLKARAFDAPVQLALPRLVDESQGKTPTILHVEPGTLIRRWFPMVGPQIVVVSQPHCGFSARAMRDIASDTVLAPVFDQHSRWLVPQQASGEPEQVLAPSRFRYTLAYTQSEFPMIDVWETPTFYFLNGTKVIKKVVGWPREGRRQEVLEGVHAIGLLPR